jgi:hypothetical protein
MKEDERRKPLSEVKIKKRVWVMNLEAVARRLTFPAVH